MTTTRRSRSDGRPTLDDVAGLAGVSRMVASRALNDAPNVSSDAVARVKRAADLLSYIPHQGARSLATNRTGAVAFLAPMSNQRFFGDPNVAGILEGVKERLTQAGTQLVTLIVEDLQDAQRAADYVKARHVDGVVVLSPELVEPLVRDLARARVPLAANGVVAGAEAMSSLIFDDRAAARTMAEILQSRGGTRCAVIAGARDRRGTKEVLRGITDVFGRLDPELIVYTDHSFQGGQEAAQQLLATAKEFDSLFVSSDVMAVAALNVLQAEGLQVPRDLRVTGWDDSVPASAATPALTTMSIPYREIGVELAGMLLNQIDGGTPTSRSIEPRPVRRASA